MKLIRLLYFSFGIGVAEEMSGVLPGHEAPVEGSVQRVADFVFGFLKENKHRLNLIEVEAKLGWVWDNEKQERLENYLTSSECALKPHEGYRFWSRIDKELLNKIVEHLVSSFSSCEKDPSVSLESSFTEDQVFEVPGMGRVRRTTDLKSQEVTWMCKKQLDHLNFQAPHLPYDYRFTVSLEEPAPALTEDSLMGGQKTVTRTKARKSFSRGLWKVEATSVDVIDHVKGTREDIYEVEVECVDSTKLSSLNHEEFLEEIKILINTTRTLTVLGMRKVRDPMTLASSASAASSSSSSSATHY